MYALKNRDAKYVIQKLIKLEGEIDKSQLQLETSTSLSLSTIDRTTRQKISKNIEELNITIIQQNIIIIYKMFHSVTVDYTFKCLRNILQDRTYPGS